MNEPIRIVSGWLSDPTNGLNAVLASLTVDVGDIAPTDVTIADATNDDDVAVGRAPKIAQGKCSISVSYDGAEDARPDSTGLHLDGKCVILIRYDGRHSSAKAAQITAGYVLRAAYICLNKLWAQDSARERNGLELIGPTMMTIIPVQPRVDTDPVLAGLRMQCEFHDTTT